MKPFFTYYGGKWRAAPHYPAPRYETIIEPFAGAAGYSIRHNADRVILIDKDPAIVGTWKYLLCVNESEILSLPDVEDAQSVDDLNISPEARILIGWWLNKGAASPCKTPSKWMRQRIRPHSFWGKTIRERIASQLEEIRHWEIHEGEYSSAPDVLATYFIDPPYISAGRHYRYTGLDYSGLALWCQGRKGQVIVCENEGASWLPFAPFRDIKANESKRGGKKSKEVIWLHG